jgi:23S rRNA pseudouridine2605 synthase
MRINRYVSAATGLSRRSADKLVDTGEILVDGQKAKPGQDILPGQKVIHKGKLLQVPEEFTTIILNKPVGYVVSRNGQGSNTIYDLLPAKYHKLKPVGRLDKDSSGLLVITDDGLLAQRLSHPSLEKIKIYDIELNKSLVPLHHQMINDYGIKLADGVSKLSLEKLDKQGRNYRVTMHEGRNRQIRRTFEALNYRVAKLHRIAFGEYRLHGLETAKYLEL